MNPRIWIALAGAAALMVAVALIDFSATDTGPAQQEYMVVMEAARLYSQDLRSRGLPVPASVPLKELLEKGLVKEELVGGLSALDVTVSLATDEIDPTEVLMRVRLRDGSEIVAMGDGSVHQRDR
ncbi:MAG: hypothetical protein K9N62_04315 [Verrucomicrobia bacterium]|nr:hypothetical protein [Verrucomicrobiota bacterium]